MRWKFLTKSPKRSPLNADWLSLWAFARYDLRLSDAEFWDLSFEQFNALAERYIQDQENQDLRAALICSLLANINRDTKKRRTPFEVKDFMPQRRPLKPKTDEQMKDDLIALTIALGGEIK